jgi:glycosyltransferase involved in cell wall biosynthesis
LKTDQVEYIVDSLNPATWLAAARNMVRFHPQKVIMPWWVTFWAPQFWTMARHIKRHSTAEIVFYCHNALEHETAYPKVLVTKKVLRLADRILTQSEQESETVRRLLGRDNIVTAYHPTINLSGPKHLTKQAARELLHVQGRVLLFFGFVREYKGLDVLLEAVALVHRQIPVTLLVVGEFWEDPHKYRQLIRRLGLDKAVIVVERYVPNEEVGRYFAAADLVVQPYRSATGSGICQLAYGYGRPVIATSVGSLAEVIEDNVNGRLVPPLDAAALSQAIMDSLDEERLSVLTANAAKVGERFSWEGLVRLICGECLSSVCQ